MNTRTSSPASHPFDVSTDVTSKTATIAGFGVAIAFDDFQVPTVDGCAIALCRTASEKLRQIAHAIDQGQPTYAFWTDGKTSNVTGPGTSIRLSNFGIAADERVAFALRLAAVQELLLIADVLAAEGVLDSPDAADAEHEAFLSYFSGTRA